MLYETLNHPKLLLLFLLAGFIGGLIFDVANFIKFLFANKKVPKIILDFIATSLCLLLIFLVNIKYFYGIIRFFPFVCFLLAFTLERYTLGKIIALIYNACYNFLIKLNDKIWRKIKNGKTNKNN